MNYTANLEIKVKELCKAIEWNDFKAMRGDENKFPMILAELASDNELLAVRAGNVLWDTICHQYSQLWSVALPSYPILVKILHETKFQQVKVEILDCLVGFACGCADHKETDSWQGELCQLMQNDLDYFRALDIDHDNDDASAYAYNVVELLTEEAPN